MSAIVKFFLLLNVLTKRLAICTLTGFLVGGLAGLMLLLLYINENGVLLLTAEEVLKISLMLAIFCWLVIVFFYCLIARYTFSSVAVPALINSFITVLLTTFSVNKFQFYLIAWFVGMLIGLMVGALLCRINTLLSVLLKK